MSTKDTIAHSLLSRAHSPTSTERIYTEKVLQRPLHLKPTHSEHPTTAQASRRLQRERKITLRKKKTKPAPLSSRQKRALCLYDLPKSRQKYEIYVPLHQMWIGYIQEILWDHGGFRPVTNAVAAKFCTADFHGAELEVVRSRCVSRVGVKGIVVKDSKGVFEVVTKTDEVKILPKEHTVFRFGVPPPVEQKFENGKEDRIGVESEEDKKEGKELIFELHGDQFMFRAADRANKKFKAHFLPDL